MNGFARLAAYAAEVLAFDFSGRAGSAAVTLPEQPEAAALVRMRDRVLAAFGRSGQSRLVLLGLGSGALAGALAHTLAPGALCVAELETGLARAVVAKGLLPCGLPHSGSPDTTPAPCGLAVDSSPWAVFALLEAAGFGPGAAFVLPNPELKPEAKRVYRVLELLLTCCVPVGPPVATATMENVPSVFPNLSVAAILAPSEPDLPDFFAQFPPWLAELVLVWDAPTVPSRSLPDWPFPVRHIARPLGADFSAQRNTMLAACTGEWVLYLDADERLTPECWAALPVLCGIGDVDGAEALGGWHFPRLTPYPEKESVLAGFGLWPDIQLRLFRNVSGLRFENPVHERLTGLAGRQGLALGMEIEHLNRLRRSDEHIRRKLAGFDEAGAGRIRHALSVEYPSVSRGVLSCSPGRGRWFVLPPQFA